MGSCHCQFEEEEDQVVMLLNYKNWLSVIICGRKVTNDVVHQSKKKKEGFRSREICLPGQLLGRSFSGSDVRLNLG